MTFTANSPACISVAACTWKTYAGFDSLIAAADSGNDDVVIQTAGSDPAAPLVTTVTSGVNDPIDVNFDASGNLFVANYGNSTVTIYAPPYTAPPAVTISNGINGPNQLRSSGRTGSSRSSTPAAGTSRCSPRLTRTKRPSRRTPDTRW